MSTTEAASKWSCDQCTFDNFKDLKYCEICGKSRSKQDQINHSNQLITPPKVNEIQPSQQSNHSSTASTATNSSPSSSNQKKAITNLIYPQLKAMGYNHMICSKAALQYPNNLNRAIHFVLSNVSNLSKDEELAQKLQSNENKQYQDQLQISLQKQDHKNKLSKRIKFLAENYQLVNTYEFNALYKKYWKESYHKCNNTRPSMLLKQYPNYFLRTDSESFKSKLFHNTKINMNSSNNFIESEKVNMNNKRRKYFDDSYSNHPKRRKLNHQYSNAFDSEEANKRSICIKIIPPNNDRRSLRREIEDTYHVSITKCDQLQNDENTPPYLICSRVELKTIKDKNKLLNLCKQCKLLLNGAIISATPYICKTENNKSANNDNSIEMPPLQVVDNKENVIVSNVVITDKMEKKKDDTQVKQAQMINVEPELPDVIFEDEVIVKKEVKPIKLENKHEFINDKQEEDKEENNDDIMFEKEKITNKSNAKYVDLVYADNLNFWVKFCPKCKTVFNRTKKDMKERCHEMICTNCVTDGEYTIWCWDCNHIIDPKRKGLIACTNCRARNRRKRNCKKHT